MSTSKSISKPRKRQPERRRAALLDSAEALFSGKGYERTTVADIMEAAGVSKGGFYHHFASKDELFVAVLDRRVARYAEMLAEIAADLEKSPLERLREIIAFEGRSLAGSDLGAHVQLLKALEQDGNRAMAERVTRLSREVLIGVLAEILQQGRVAGEFSLDDPGAAADLLSHLFYAYSRARLMAIAARGTPEASQAAQHLRSVMKLQYSTMDHLLGLPAGTMSYGWDGYAEALMAVPVAPGSDF